MIEKTDLGNFYKLLQRKKISEKNMDRKFFGWNSSEIINFIEEAYELLLMQPIVAKSLFSFAPNSSLSGAPFPCSSIECRLTKLDSLARFSALYANQVVITNPFEKYIFSHQLAEALEQEPSARFIRVSLMGDVLGLLYVRPLFEAGILSIRNGVTSLCAEHLAEAEALEAKIRGKLEKAEKQLQKRYRRETKVEITSRDDEVFLTVSGPDYLIEHRKMDLVGKLPPFLLDNYEIGQNRELTRKELKEFDVFSRLTRPIVRDIFDQNVEVHLSKSHYLTHREIDFDIITTMGNENVTRTSETLIGGLAHSIPTITNIPINKLVKLRQKEGEAFEVYRDTISRVLKQAKTLAKEEIVELVDDEVRPEIHKIERTIKNSRRLVARSLSKDILVSAGYITVGIFSGFLSADAGALITALGGYKFATSVIEQVTSLKTP